MFWVSPSSCSAREGQRQSAITRWRSHSTQVGSAHESPPPVCLALRYPPSRNSAADLFPAGVQFSAADSVVHFWWDRPTADVRELQRQTRGVGRWRRLGPDSISATVHASLNENFMTLVFAVARDHVYAAVSTHSAEDPTVVAVATRVSCRSRRTDIFYPR